MVLMCNGTIPQLSLSGEDGWHSLTAPRAAHASPATGAATAEPVKVESEKIEIFSPPTFSGRSFMVQHLLHIQNLVTPEICYNIKRSETLEQLYTGGIGGSIPSRSTTKNL